MSDTDGQSVISVYDYVDTVGPNVLPVSLDKISTWDSTISCNVKAASYLPRRVADVIPLLEEGTINGVFSFVPFWVDNKSRQFFINFIKSRGMVEVKKITEEDVDEKLACAEESFDESSVDYDWKNTVPYSYVDNIMMVIVRAGGARTDYP